MWVMKILAAVGGAAPAEPACLGGKSARPIPQIAVWSGGASRPFESDRGCATGELGVGTGRLAAISCGAWHWRLKACLV